MTRIDVNTMREFSGGVDGGWRAYPLHEPWSDEFEGFGWTKPVKFIDRIGIE